MCVFCFAVGYLTQSVTNIERQVTLCSIATRQTETDREWKFIILYSIQIYSFLVFVNPSIWHICYCVIQTSIIQFDLNCNQPPTKYGFWQSWAFDTRNNNIFPCCHLNYVLLFVYRQIYIRGLFIYFRLNFQIVKLWFYWKKQSEKLLCGNKNKGIVYSKKNNLRSHQQELKLPKVFVIHFNVIALL